LAGTRQAHLEDQNDSQNLYFRRQRRDGLAFISRADLARFMLDEIQSPRYVGKQVVVQA